MNKLYSSYHCSYTIHGKIIVNVKLVIIVKCISIRPYSFFRSWTGPSLKLRLMRGVFTNINYISLFLMISPTLVPVQSNTSKWPIVRLFDYKDRIIMRQTLPWQLNPPRIPQAINIPTYIGDTLALTFSSIYGIPKATIGVQPAPATTIPRMNSA